MAKHVLEINIFPPLVSPGGAKGIPVLMPDCSSESFSHITFSGSRLSIKTNCERSHSEATARLVRLKSCLKSPTGVKCCHHSGLLGLQASKGSNYYQSAIKQRSETREKLLGRDGSSPPRRKTILASHFKAFFYIW
jgi:hypothetical protein